MNRRYIVIMYANDKRGCERFSVEVKEEYFTISVVGSGLMHSLSKWTHLVVVFKRTGNLCFHIIHCVDEKKKGILYPVKIDVHLNGEFQNSKRTKRYIQVCFSFSGISFPVIISRAAFHFRLAASTIAVISSRA